MMAFIVTLALTLYMCGMIWSMQILEYPLFALVGPREFPTYHQRHSRGLPLLVILPSLAAFASAPLRRISTCCGSAKLLLLTLLRKEHFELPNRGSPLGKLVAELSHQDDHEHPTASSDTEQE